MIDHPAIAADDRTSRYSSHGKYSTEELEALAQEINTYWLEREGMPRTVCSECQFESTIGYRESHQSDCPYANTR